jgi:hypothetical protein
MARKLLRKRKASSSGDDADEAAVGSYTDGLDARKKREAEESRKEKRDTVARALCKLKEERKLKEEHKFQAIS